MTNLELRDIDAKLMWRIGELGKRISLPPLVHELKNASRIKRWAIKKLLPGKNVDFFILVEDGITKLYVEESSSKYDWRMNFMALSYKATIGTEQCWVHPGFYLTAITIYRYLEQEGLAEKVFENRSYSHGSGASPLLSLMIMFNPICSLLHERDTGQESPCCISRPSKKIKEMSKNFIWYKQGRDIVTSVPWWMTHLGQKRKVPGKKLKGIKRLFRIFFDHDIRHIKGK